MRISNVMEQERLITEQSRKKLLQRKEAGDAYRKNAQYFQPKKSPVLQELENLLLGRKEHSLYAQHKEESRDVSHEQQSMMQNLQQTEQTMRAHKVSASDAMEILPEEELDTLQILEQVRHAALASAEPSAQDLRVAASVNAQIQRIQGQDIEEEPPFVNETIDVKIPERFSKELKLDPLAETIFTKSYGEAMKGQLFQYASSKYMTHIQMAQNGYRMGTEPVFSWTA
ncbi:hypothetical protein [Lysinibacillus piscis]|uniref:Uncharacterized protein n=1 Tax=Lysinibacillus piscis TaxID=2518931 RepID=A0ABQ5NJ09_9BACI|nr:hypothetical protein [Lysinibacillus sp. KH24]GLC88009.1 hypothetical protein LYSBPC_11360 [Lysinibacillus sp. KH24]